MKQKIIPVHPPFAEGRNGTDWTVAPKGATAKAFGLDDYRAAKAAGIDPFNRTLEGAMRFARFLAGRGYGVAVFGCPVI